MDRGGPQLLARHQWTETVCQTKRLPPQVWLRNAIRRLSWPNPASRQITHERAVRCTRLDLSVTNAFVTNAFCHALLSMLRSGNFWDHATPETDHQLRPVRAVHQSVRRFRPQPDLFRVEGLCDSGCLPRRHLRRRSPGGRPGPPYSRGLEQTPHVLLVQPDPGYPPQPGRAG